MLKNIKWSRILFAAAYIATGILLILFPKESADLIGYIVGIGLCVMGIVQLTAYFLLALLPVIHEYKEAMMWKRLRQDI